MHLYAFGSLCRGEIDRDSDMDLLAIVENADERLNPELFSIYSYERLHDLWRAGNAFAWHLSLEARLLFAADGKDWIESIGQPAHYATRLADCLKFLGIYQQAVDEIQFADSVSATFELSTIFLSIRNFATCYSLGGTKPTFSRHAALRLDSFSLNIPAQAYNVLERARILSTRGRGSSITEEEIQVAASQFGRISEWMHHLMCQARAHE